jgi:hypothetical protein|tara:strand:+ start:663 stop:875 length:213 start_codon:yes stop_codon:yes gene_type:complete
MIEAIIWYAFLLDSVIANGLVWFNPKYFKKSVLYKPFLKLFPVTKGWCALYLGLVLWVGYALLRLNILPW